MVERRSELRNGWHGEGRGVYKYRKKDYEIIYINLDGDNLHVEVREEGQKVYAVNLTYIFPENLPIIYGEAGNFGALLKEKEELRSAGERDLPREKNTGLLKILSLVEEKHTTPPTRQEE